MISFEDVPQTNSLGELQKENPSLQKIQSKNKKFCKSSIEMQLPIAKQTMKEKKLKNFPKLIGNNFCKFATQNLKRFPKGIQQLIKKKNQPQQVGFKISDLRNACQYDEESRRLFQIYFKNQLLLDLIFSSKINDPFPYIPGICNYYAASFVPDKMVSSYITQ
ncbi:unnamed protein product [Paramecium sonneborni]|uniref:Uncharacterized protein n=1 Tax=Paramecium sonneborni TaxID=65129 RepID=A0A8S1PS38_9CILI|nr:unnamed protein product [Paramecium sonneborni]